MAVNANSNETYDVAVIREDLQEAYISISPQDTPFQQALKKGAPATATLHEWSVVDLAAVDSSNRAVEGDDSPTINAPTNADRRGNYTQISTKQVSVTHTAQAVDAAANNSQRLAQQIAFKLAELKRDKETMLLSNVAANAGASGTARVAAGFPAWLRTNTNFPAGGSDPTVSNGIPNAAAGDGTTPRLFAEDDFNDVMESCWTNGGRPTMMLLNSGNKRRVSQAFSGNSTQYKNAVDKAVINAVDFYTTDFGDITLIPTRFLPTANASGDDDAYMVLLIDPMYASISYLDEVRQDSIAKTGLSEKVLISCEYTLQVDNEAAHGIIRDTTNAVS